MLYHTFTTQHEIDQEYNPVKGKNHFNIIDDFLGDGGAFCENLLEWSQEN